MNAPATILVVDDIEANRDTLRELLEAERYHVAEAADGPTALRLAAENPPDLVLLDVMMPGMDGLEVCRRLRAERGLAEVPVIIVTALDDRSSRLAGLEAGADDFITKPFNRAELRARVRTITRLNRYRRLHEVRAELYESENHFRALFELGPVAIYSCDAAGTIQSFNRRAAVLWGREPKLGDPIDRFCGAHKLHRPDGPWLPHEQCPMAGVLSGEIPAVEGAEVIIERLDGSRLTVAVNIVPLKNARGEITGAINSFQDVTARKVAECALRESAEWLRAVFEQPAVGVVQTNVATGRFMRTNQRFREIVGYTAEEIAKLSFADITHPHDLALSMTNRTLLGAGSVREFAQEKRYVRKDGSVVWTSIAVSSSGPAGKPPLSFIAFVQDITERRRLDDHFLQAQKMEALGQFSGGVAHDFNNILAAIGGYTELSRMILKDNTDVRDHLGAVLKATGRATDLVRQILTFSRQQPQIRQPLHLQPIMVESIKLMRATIPTTVEIETSTAAGLPAVLANANQVHQILINLGINGWHAMRDRPGRLHLALEKFVVTPEYAATKPRLHPGSYVRLSVSDTGSGMDQATLLRIFEPFFTTKAPGDGTGLGLSVVHGIMDSHDGAVTVHSQPGEGTVFRLYFPVHGGETTVSVFQEEPTPRGHGEAILVVDDEELLALLNQKTLTNLGYRVEYRTDPGAALALITADPDRFKLVLSDQTMPGMTGLVLAQHLKKICPKLPVLLMTGYSLSLTAERIEEAGVRQLMLKPTTIQALGCAVHAALSGQPPTDHNSHPLYR